MYVRVCVCGCVRVCMCVCHIAGGDFPRVFRDVSYAFVPVCFCLFVCPDVSMRVYRAGSSVMVPPVYLCACMFVYASTGRAHLRWCRHPSG